MPYSVVQTKGNTGTGTSLVTVLDSNTTTGNLILVQILLAFPVFSNISSVTDSQGNSYASVGSPQTLSNSQLLTYYAFNITGGTTPTVTANFTGSGQQNAVQIREYSGIATTSPLDVIAGAAGNSNSPSATTATTTNANDIVIGSIASNISTTASAGSGYGNASTYNASNITLFLEDKEVNATGAQTANATLGQVWNWGAQAITFKLAAGGPPPTTASASTVMMMGV